MSTKYKVGDCVIFKPVYAEFFRLAHSIPHGTHGVITVAENPPDKPWFTVSGLTLDIPHYQIVFPTGSKVFVAGDDLLEKIPAAQQEPSQGVL